MIEHFEPVQIPERVPGALESANDALRFMFGGNAVFTLRSEKTSTRFTYKIRQKDETYLSSCRSSSARAMRRTINISASSPAPIAGR